MKNKLILALFVGVLLVSGIASAQVATTSTTAGTVASCPTFAAVDVAALRIKCAAEGGTVYQPEATSGCLPPPICQKTDKFICPMLVSASPELEQKCIALGGRLVSGVSKYGCPVPPVCERQIVRKAEISINPEGRFTGRGLIVKSIASTTLVAEVWGTSWTIDFSSVKNVILKNGSEQRVDTVATQVLGGQEISVLGRVSKDRPGIVIAEVLRNYNQTEVISPVRGTELWEKYGNKLENEVEQRLEQQKKQFEIQNEQMKNNAEMEKERNGELKSTNSEKAEKLQEMLKQLQELQRKLQGNR